MYSSDHEQVLHEVQPEVRWAVKTYKCAVAKF